MQDLELLEKIGLAKNDRAVYLSLLELGSSTVSDLVKRTGLHRSYCYDILDKLIQMGLVSFIDKNKIRYFQSENPEKIAEIIAEKAQAIEQTKQQIDKILPELQKRQNIAMEKQQAQLFMGKEGIKSILEDILRTRKDFVGFGAEGKFKDIFKWYFDNWQRRRAQLKLRYKILYNSKLRGKRPTLEQKFVDVRFLPAKYEFPATTIIYGRKVAIIIWDANPIAFELESEKAAKSFQSYFELLWGMAEK